MFIEINGLQMHYEVWGEGEPLIMVHGNGGSLTIFYAAAEILQEYFSCYLIDLRGHGESEDVEDLRYEWMADDINTFIEELGLAPVNYYGFSDGGNIGLIAASRCPDYYKSLIVSGACMNPHGAKGGVYRDIKYNSDWDDPKVRLLLFQPHITNADLRRITAHSLVLAGQYDLITREHTLRIGHQIPDCRVKILRGEGHGSYVENNPKLARILLRFLRPELFRNEKEQ